MQVSIRAYRNATADNRICGAKLLRVYPEKVISFWQELRGIIIIPSMPVPTDVRIGRPDRTTVYATFVYLASCAGKQSRLLLRYSGQPSLWDGAG
jgi:hypothetical protein